MVAALLHLGVALIRPAFAATGDAMRRVSVYLKFIAAPHGPLAPMVNHNQFVREIEHQVALVGRTFQMQPYRLKLKSEVIAERAIQTQMRLRSTVEELDQLAQHRKSDGC